jgi:hypothetical protein
MATPEEGLEVDHPIDVGDGKGNRLHASYWRVGGYDVDRNKRRIALEVRGWRSFVDYEAGLPYVEELRFTVTEPSFNEYFGKKQVSKKGRNAIVQAYVYLRSETKEFSSATTLPKTTNTDTNG